MPKKHNAGDIISDSWVYLIGVLVVMVLAFFDNSHTSAVQQVRQPDKSFGYSGYGKYENECRRILQCLFLKPFPKVRPDFLRNPKTGRNLELDMYNQDIALALE